MFNARVRSLFSNSLSVKIPFSRLHFPQVTCRLLTEVGPPLDSGIT